MEEFEDFEPIQLTTEKVDDKDKVHLFSIDGRDYLVPKKVPYRVTLKASKIFAEKTQAQAEAYVMTQFLGEEAYDALCESTVTEEEFEKIADLASKVVMGKAKNQGNRASRRGSKK